MALATQEMGVYALLAWQRAGALHRRMRALLAKIDPNDDPGAEPLMLTPLLCLAVAVGCSVWMYWRFVYQPMQDMGHHVGLAAVVADYNRPGSLYPELYEPPDPLYANSLYYTVAGYSGRFIGVTRAARGAMLLYVAGVPLANAYALRVFGRSTWPAVLTVPLTLFNMNFVAGFTNLLFAAPFLVLSIPLFWRALTRPTWKRLLVASLDFVCVFLAHAHVFLWCGALAFALTLALFVARLAMAAPLETRARPWRRRVAGRLLGAGKVAGLSLATVVPSLLLFWRWYHFAFGENASKGSVQVVASGWENNFGAYYKPTAQLFHDLWAYAAKTLVADDDLILLSKVGMLVALAVVLARLHRWRRPPVLEMAWALTVASYFFMPEAIDSNPVVGSRQIGVSMWLLAALASPVPASVSRLARYLVVGGILWLTREHLGVWHENLLLFEAKEAYGIDYVLEPAPYRKMLHLVKVMPDTSNVFQWKPNWHVDKYYMSERLGQVPDNPAIVSTSSIRYREGVDVHRITWHSPDWSSSEELWRFYDLVLVHGWQPTEAQLEAAKSRGVRLRKQGDWELWRKKGEWQEKGDGPPPAVPR